MPLSQYYLAQIAIASQLMNYKFSEDACKASEKYV